MMENINEIMKLSWKTILIVMISVVIASTISIYLGFYYREVEKIDSIHQTLRQGSKYTGSYIKDYSLVYDKEIIDNKTNLNLKPIDNKLYLYKGESDDLNYSLFEIDE